MALFSRSVRALWVVFAGAVAPGFAACAPVSASQGATGGPTDAAPHADAALADTGLIGPASDGAACSPGDVATFQPVYHPADMMTGACAPEQAQALFDACFGDAKSDTACHAFRTDPTNFACTACVLTPDSAPQYGPIIDHRTFVTANVAGCIELAVGLGVSTDAGGAEIACAKDVQALESCQLAACAANCDVQDLASLAAFQSCATAANGGGCSPYATAASCLGGVAEAGGELGACLLPDFASFYAAVVPLFCVAPPGIDGGGPSGDAGSAGD